MGSSPVLPVSNTVGWQQWHYSNCPVTDPLQSAASDARLTQVAALTNNGTEPCGPLKEWRISWPVNNSSREPYGNAGILKAWICTFDFHKAGNIFMYRTVPELGCVNGGLCENSDGHSDFVMNRDFLVRFQLFTAASMKMTVFWDVAPCSVVTTMMDQVEAVNISQTSVNFYETT
jgi:hypothetical protein